MAVSTSSAGTAGVLGDLLLSTGNATVGNSGTVDVGTGLSASGSGGPSLHFQLAVGAYSLPVDSKQ